MRISHYITHKYTEEECKMRSRCQVKARSFEYIYIYPNAHLNFPYTLPAIQNEHSLVSLLGSVNIHFAQWAVFISVLNQPKCRSAQNLGCIFVLMHCIIEFKRKCMKSCIYISCYIFIYFFNMCCNAILIAYKCTLKVSHLSISIGYV